MPELTAPRGRGYHGNSMENGEGMRPPEQIKSEPLIKHAELIENYDSRLGIMSYFSLKPDVNKWQARDYARVLTMIGPEAMNNANARKLEYSLKECFESDAGLKASVYGELATIEGKFDFFIKKDKWDTEKLADRDDDLASRAFFMHAELWKELGIAGGDTANLKKLSGDQLWNYLKYLSTETPRSKRANQMHAQINTAEDNLRKELEHRYTASGNGGGGGGGDGGSGSGAGGGNPWEREMLEAQRALLRVNVEQLTELKTINLTLKEIQQNMKELSSQLCVFDEDTEEGKRNAQEVKRRMLENAEAQSNYIKEKVRIEKEIAERRKETAESELKEQDSKTRTALMNEENTRENSEEYRKRREAKDMLLDKKPWERKDRELYEGDVHEVLRERKWRIAYLCARSEAGGKEVDRGVLTRMLMDSDGADKGEYQAKLINEFLERMEKNQIYEELDKKGEVEREMGTYMQEIKRWAKDIIGNSQYERGRLEIPTSLYDQLKDIQASKVHLHEYGSVTDSVVKARFREDLKKSINSLGKMDFESAFTKVNEYGEVIGVKYRPQSEYAGEDTPKDLYETCRLIEMLYPEEHYKTGEEHELFNEYGEFQLHNFLNYTYERMWEYSDRNSQSQVNLLGDIGLRTRYTELTFGQLMEIPKYTQIRKYKMGGKVKEFGDGDDKQGKFVPGTLETGWGDYEDHPNFNLGVRDIIKRFVWQLQVRHNGGVNFINPNTRAELGESVKVMYEMAGKGDEYRNGYLLMTMQRPSSKAGEVEDYFKNNKQGSVGKAERDANLVLRHMKELSEHYTKKEKGKVVGVRSIEENYALKALGYDGASSLMLKIAESSLMFCEQRANIQMEFRKYQAFVMDQMKAAYGTGLPEEKKDELNQLVEKKKEELKKSDVDKEAISFDSSKAINDLLMAIETNILGKTIVRDNEFDKWKDTGKVISRKFVNEETRRKLREHMKAQFFDKILDLEIVDESGGTSVRKRMGDIEVKTCNGQVVTDSEWGKIDKDMASKGTKTIKEIFNEFDDFGKIEGGKLKKDELDYAIRINELKQEIAEAEKDGRTADVSRKKAELAAHKITQKEDYQRIYERNERLGLALLTKVAKVKRSELNYFNSPEPSRTALTISRDSIVSSAAKVYGLSDIEKKVVGEGIHYDQVLNGNALINNTASPRINALSWFVRTKEMWKASRGVRPNSGLYDEVKAIMPGTWWDVMSVHVLNTGVRTNYTKLFQGNADTVEEMVDREDRIQDGNRRLYDTSREEFGYKFSRYIMDGAKFIENLKKDESLELHKLVTRDAKGTLRFDTEKARKEMAEHWHPMWDAINKTGIDQEAYVRVDGETIKNKQYLFGDKTLAAVEAMRFYHASLAKESINKNRNINGEMAKELESKYAMGVLAAFYAASIKEHNEMFSGINDYWNPELAQQMWWFLSNYLKKEGENVDGKMVEVTYMPMGMMDDVLEIENLSEKKLVLKNFLVEFIASIFDGVFSKGLKELMDELVQIEKIYRAR